MLKYIRLDSTSISGGVLNPYDLSPYDEYEEMPLAELLDTCQATRRSILYCLSQKIELNQAVIMHIRHKCDHCQAFFWKCYETFYEDDDTMAALEQSRVPSE